MQILSYIQWYHFAYMIISVALLGFGAAGTFLTIFRQRLLNNYTRIFPSLLIITAILMAVTVIGVNLDAVRFDSLLIFQDLRYTGRLIATYFIFFLPFFTGALAIGLSFLKFANQIGKIYFANLVGSGLGGIISLILMHFFSVEQLPLLIAVIALAGGLVSFPKNAGKILQSMTIISILILLGVFFNGSKLKPSEYKDISKTLLLPAATIEYEKSSPYGLVQIISSPVLRFAPGVSLSYRDTFPVRKVVFNNGNFIGYLVPETDQEKSSILNYTTQSLPYHIEKIDNVLILNTGTGENISLALSHKVSNIIANEANSEIFDLLQNSFVDQYSVKLKQTMSRNILTSLSASYDLIQLPIIGSFFGNSGLNAIESRYELNIEAFHEMWDKLSDNGMISISCWMDYPVRNSYRILATFDQLLEEKNIKQPNEHIIAVRSWSGVTFLLKKSGFTKIQEKQVQIFCKDLMFDPLLLPGTKEINYGKYNIIQDTSFFRNIESLLSSKDEEFFDEYSYRVKPATDNRPFFFQNIRWSGIHQIISTIGEGSLPFLELGYVLVLFTFIQIIVIAGIFIILPLFIKSWKSNNKMWVFSYFSGIGLAFMFIEIVFIQQFTFYFGEAIYAAAACISILLIFSGLGSYFSTSLRITKKILLIVPIIITVLLLFHTFTLSTILSYTIAKSISLKILTSIVLIGITGFFLGIPFPAGIKYLSNNNQIDIPWAWAFNGYFSVISTALATIISVEAGFVWVLLLAAITYASVGMAILFIKKMDK
ncbi:MAG: hypothetical protein PF484_10065 [Bacteroidales bacterium]|nr:hypothetical protein [Bacteroidales bacterium]